MIIEPGTSVSCIKNFTSEVEDLLSGKLQYTNKSVSYQVKRHVDNRDRILWVLRHKGYTTKEAGEIWQKEIEDLKSQIKVHLIKKKDEMLIFPAGLTERVIALLTKNHISFVIEDRRVKPTTLHQWPIQTSSLNLRPYQKEAVQALLSKGQATMVGGTGIGKTACFQAITHQLGLKTVIVVPSISIFHQTIRRFEKYFGKSLVGTFGDGKKKPKDITICVARSLSDSDSSIWKGTDLLIADECHHAPADTLKRIAFQKIPDAFYRFSFTATPYRADGGNLMIEGVSFPTAYEYTVKRGIQEGYLAEPIFTCFRLKKTSGTYSGSDPMKAYQSHILDNKFLNERAINIATVLAGQGLKILIMVKEKDHGHLLHGSLPNATFLRTRETPAERSRIERIYKHYAPFVDDQEGVDEFNAGRVPILIGTSIIGEGTDLIPVDAQLILTGGLSQSSIVQMVGRSLRTGAENPFEGKRHVHIMDFICEGHPLLEKHALERMDYYRELGTVEECPL